MAWYVILLLGTAAGILCGGFFWVLGELLDWRERRQWQQELTNPDAPRDIIIPIQRDGGHDADGN